MADRPRTPAREVLRIIAISPFALFLGFHVPFLAWGAWQKLRIPYFVAMPLLFGLEMSAVDFLLISPEHRAVLLWVDGTLLLLVSVISFILGLLGGRKRLMEGPGNVEGFLPAHMLFMLLWFLVPILFGTQIAR